MSNQADYRQSIGQAGCLIECPFCTASIKDEALVCRHCSRDLRVVRPVVIENRNLVAKLNQLQRELYHNNAQLAFYDRPFVLRLATLYVLIPSLLLLEAHVIVTILLDVSAVYLRIISVIIPIPFGVMLYAVSKIGLRGAFGFGIATAFLSVAAMLIVVGYVDKVPILPDTPREWREASEYVLSIMLAYLTGGLLATLIFSLTAECDGHFRSSECHGDPAGADVGSARGTGSHASKGGGSSKN